jgi:hypothetical protein
VTLGIVAQTVALVPALRATGFRFRPRLDLRGSGLGHAARLRRWVFLYVVASQAAYLVVVRLATAAGELSPGRGYSAYLYAFTLWQLPHAIVAVSVITALLPRMSSAAADGRTADLRASLERGLRLTVSVLVPAAVAFVVLGREMATVVFARVNISVEQAQFIGLLLAVFAVGLVPFSAYQLQLRSFYAMADTRTPTLINLGRQRDARRRRPRPVRRAARRPQGGRARGRARDVVLRRPAAVLRRPVAPGRRARRPRGRPHRRALPARRRGAGRAGVAARGRGDRPRRRGTARRGRGAGRGGAGPRRGLPAAGAPDAGGGGRGGRRVRCCAACVGEVPDRRVRRPSIGTSAVRAPRDAGGPGGGSVAPPPAPEAPPTWSRATCWRRATGSSRPRPPRRRAPQPALWLAHDEVLARPGRGQGAGRERTRAAAALTGPVPRRRRAAGRRGRRPGARAGLRRRP